MFRPVLLTLLLTSACALLPDKSKTPEAPEKVGDPRARPQAGIEAKQLAAEREADALAEIVFAKGASRLTPQEAARLSALTKRLAQKNKAERVVVAAWADQSLPGEQGKPLSEASVKLAEARGEAIRVYLEKSGAKDVEFHNMAKKPTSFAKFIGADDARIKKSLEGSRPSKAIVLVIGND